MNHLFEKATDPSQYDGDLLWYKEGRAESTRTGFFLEHLDPYMKSWAGKSVLDIGAGTGWLVARAMEYGAKKVVGIEPSENNITQCMHDHPGVELVQTTLEEFDAKGQRFDEIIAVMSFPHIGDLEMAFQKIRTLMTKNAETLLVVPDYDYFNRTRHDYSVEIHDIDDNSYITSVTRPYGNLVDIVRKTNLFELAAESAGLKLIKEVGMKPTENQMTKAPSYAEVKDQALTRLLVFRNADEMSE